MRQKKCRYCKQPFTPVLPMQVVCGIECAKAIAKSKREKVEKANDRQKREQLKTRSQWMKEAQIAFNAYIRARDANKPCICCGADLVAEAVGGGFDCGHYRSVGSAPHLRFDERNANGQRKQCIKSFILQEVVSCKIFSCTSLKFSSLQLSVYFV